MKQVSFGFSSSLILLATLFFHAAMTQDEVMLDALRRPSLAKHINEKMVGKYVTALGLAARLGNPNAVVTLLGWKPDLNLLVSRRTSESHGSGRVFHDGSHACLRVPYAPPRRQQLAHHQR